MSLDLIIDILLASPVYDGTNGAALAADLGGTVASDDGATLVVDLNGAQHYIQVGQRLICRDNGTDPLQAQNTPAQDEYDARYRRFPRLVTATGFDSVSASLLGATQTVDVAISPAMSGTDYIPIATPRGTPTVLSGHGITAVSVLDEETVRVTVVSAPGSLAGATVHVVAHEVV